ncbi:MAG TPA: FGGY family carbohydrate kinase [Chitinophagaceae bacterium]|nr:FGGY family carbohydrate kinase [Chitinophagaceae bacterium]
MPLPVIAIFDIGKTNKKRLLFNEQYSIVDEQAVQFEEIIDEDGEACEDLDKVSYWLKYSLEEIIRNKKFDLKAINFSAYGASMVYVNEAGEVLTPLYNYLKKYPASLAAKFYETYGGEERVCLETSSPSLGSLNSGLQLYRLKHEQPATFSKVKYALHLPQFISYLVTNQVYSDLTSVGCHTAMWNFREDDYHDWLRKENLLHLLPPLVSSDAAIPTKEFQNDIIAGIGLHDSSAALIPYLLTHREPFVLISTGTWSISLNPFNQSPLTISELQNDCLCNLSFEGSPVKTARLFAGYQHDQQVKRLNDHFNKAAGYYKQIQFNPVIATNLKRGLPGSPPIENRDLSVFQEFETAYHQLMLELVLKQQKSTQLVLNGASVKRIFVDGGFSQNLVYMHLLAAAFPELEIYAASVPQASALGAALVLHQHWNNQNAFKDLIELKHFPAGKDVLFVE